MPTCLRRFLLALSQILILLVPPLAAAESGANSGAGKIGVVVMHGKGGSPSKHVADLAASLQGQGFLVANLEMPWSGRRDYDVDVGTAVKEVEAALAALRDQGAEKLFVAGHSQGGLFALYFADQHAIAGIIAIAPGGNVASPAFREKLGDALEQARQLVAAGKGAEKTRLFDFEGSRGTYPIATSPASYLSWFDPDGAMNQTKAVRNLNPAVPVLFIAPSGDYPGLQRVKQQMFDALPKHPRSKLYEPDSSHLNAPSASAKEIAAWMTAVANGQ
jgi:pimeloyl-ACP methyl ester carboxylesterase